LLSGLNIVLRIIKAIRAHTIRW